MYWHPCKCRPVSLLLHWLLPGQEITCATSFTWHPYPRIFPLQAWISGCFMEAWFPSCLGLLLPGSLSSSSSSWLWKEQVNVKEYICTPIGDTLHSGLVDKFSHYANALCVSLREVDQLVIFGCHLTRDKTWQASSAHRTKHTHH